MLWGVLQLYWRWDSIQTGPFSWTLGDWLTRDPGLLFSHCLSTRNKHILCNPWDLEVLSLTESAQWTCFSPCCCPQSLHSSIMDFWSSLPWLLGLAHQTPAVLCQYPRLEGNIPRDISFLHFSLNIYGESPESNHHKRNSGTACAGIDLLEGLTHSLGRSSQAIPPPASSFSQIVSHTSQIHTPDPGLSLNQRYVYSA